MIMEAIAGAVSQWFGWSGAPIHSDIGPKQEMLRSAHARGWKDWITIYADPDKPYNYEHVWIWRLDWEMPVEADPHHMDPQMNANGLLWKPWRP